VSASAPREAFDSNTFARARLRQSLCCPREWRTQGIAWSAVALCPNVRYRPRSSNGGQRINYRAVLLTQSKKLGGNWRGVRCLPSGVVNEIVGEHNKMQMIEGEILVSPQSFSAIFCIDCNKNRIIQGPYLSRALSSYSGGLARWRGLKR
jgi:hypothetical protein